MLHLYSLTTTFRNGVEWKLKIAAVTAKAVTDYVGETFDTDENPVIDIRITLLCRDYEREDNPFFRARIVE